MHVSAESSVDVLYRTHRAELCALAQSYVGCPDTAEDLVQDVFLQLWTLRGRRSDPDIPSFRPSSRSAVAVIRGFRG